MGDTAAALQRRRGMLAQSIRWLCGVWVVASLGYMQTIVLNTHGKPVIFPILRV
jgi:hypothetical protein